MPFIVWTDHQNLEYIRSAKRLNARQARWALFFGRFEFTISFRPGSKNLKPDTLSRVMFVPRLSVVSHHRQDFLDPSPFHHVRGPTLRWIL